MSRFFRHAVWLLTVAVLVSAAPLAQADDVEDAIEKAREFLGRERDLDGLRSVKFIGRIEDDAGGSGTIEIVFQKPLFHRISIQVNEMTDIKALDDYEGWNHTKNAEGQWRFRILDPVEVARMRAIVWENLNFYSGISRLGGQVISRGRETVDGVDTVKLDFIHRSDIVFTRYFDRKTGRLVMTATDANTQIREEGEIKQNNIRFPKKVITTTTFERIPEGGTEPVKETRKTTITFDSISVNETFPRSTFEMPLFTTMP
jgi:hypothetical protein